MLHATNRSPRRLASVFLGLLLAALLPSTLHAQTVAFGPGLESTLAALNPTEQLTVIVTYDQEGPLSATQVDALGALGITQGITFESLPIAGVLATPAQVYALAGFEDVVSIWPNEELTYYNEDSRDITGVNRLRTDSNLRNDMGLPFSGKSVTVVVNDSGIDATHADLEYGTHVVENVQALTNLNAVSGLLPITYTEGQPNTDTNSGHGTHVAGTVGGTGAQSGGKYEGVAPGADLIGYGSGGGLFILDGLGGFDYAITHQFSFRNPIRVITNSWGSTAAFDPSNPIVQATYRCYQRGITVLFAAGNEGPGSDTHNPYAIAPWAISVGAGVKDGTLASFSSRGVQGEATTFTTYDGLEWTAHNEVSVTAPGVDIISVRASTNLTANGGDADIDAIEPAYLPFYTMISGTSMATPHVAGIVALMLEANPTLQPDEIKAILKATATNIPGRETWEAGTGYANAYAAVINALGLRTDFGATLNAGRTFNSSVNLSVQTTPVSIDYNPVPALSADGNTHTFTVPSGLAMLTARIIADGVLGETGNTIYPVLIAPDGTEYSSGTTLLFPLDFNRVEIVSNPAPGTWTLEIRGIQNGTGNNVVSLPEQVDGELVFTNVSGFSGLNDIDGHPAAGAVQNAVYHRLLDGFADGTYRPDELLKRAALAEYLVMGHGVRQFLPLSGAPFGDVPASLAPFAEAVTARGAALKDQAQFADGLVRTSGGGFNPSGTVSRAELAYTMVQSLGLQAAATSFSGDVTVTYQGEAIEIEDQDAIPAGLKGYVQLALDLNILNAYFSLEQGPFDLTPTIHAAFRPTEEVTRGRYAVSAVMTYTHYLNGVTLNEESADARFAGNDTSTGEAALMDTELQYETHAEESFELRNYPNPFNPTTTISFTLPQNGTARLAVYNLLGQQVRVLADGALEAGTHTVPFDAGALASGTYLYRLELPNQTLTRRMVLMK